MKKGVFSQISWAFLLVSLPIVAFSASNGSDGRALYAEHCAVCHGENGDGMSRARGLNPPPRDFTSLQSAMELDRERVLFGITKGVVGTSMAGWESRLQRDEIVAITDHVVNNFLSKARDVLPPEVLASLDLGEQLYMENCSVCHGDYGETGVWTRSNMATAPRNFTTDRAKGELSRKRMIESITYGVPDKAMMPYGSRLTPSQVGSVADYIRIALMGMPVDVVVAEKQALLAEQAVANRAVEAVPAFINSKEFMNEPFPDEVMGDPNEGRIIYVRNCFACHGVKGNGQGPRAFFINPKPRNFTSESSRRALNRPKIYKAVHGGLKGSVMPAWSKVLSDQEVANVSEFVFRAFILADMRGVNQEDLEQSRQKKN